MFTNTNLSAPIGALLFIATAVALLLVTVVLLYALLRKKTLLRRFAFLTLTTVAGVYVGLMLIFSWSSSDRVLLRGQEKYFCEIDCHLAYSVLDVRQTKSLGNPAQPLNASGTFYVIIVRTRFDETTISSRRGNGSLSPNSRLVAIVDRTGSRFEPAQAAQALVEQSAPEGTPMNSPLRPGESYISTLIFDLPPTVQAPVLLINEGDWITRFVIGNENSLAHKKTVFQI
jgi:hypothetical protein